MARRALRIIAALVSATACTAHCQSIDAAALDKLIAHMVEGRKLVGLSVGIMHQGKVILAKGYGVASLATRQPASVETMFRIGSITKQFTCGLAYRLAEEGKLSMSDPVSRHFTEAMRGGEVTLADLGNHVSGYRDYYPLDYPDRAMLATRDPADVIRDHVNSLEFAPGAQWSYSNTNFLMLGSIVERIEGAPFARVLERRVLEPLGLRHTAFELRADDPRAATGYRSFALGEPAAVAYEATSWLGGAGAMWSTAGDLLAWNLALMDGKLLSASSRQAMTSPRKLANGRTTNYGCGIGIGEREGMLVWGHTGAVAGFTARNSVFPDTRSAVVLMTNTDTAHAPLADIYAAIARHLVPPRPQPLTVSGMPALAVAASLFGQMQVGTLDRSRLSEEFNAFLSPERVKSAASSLSRLGKPKSIEVASVGERAGMEQSTILIKFDTETLEASMFRSQDGTVHQFLVYRK